MKRTLFTTIVGCSVFLSISSNLWAQATAQISGTAKDRTGAVLPGVEITATQTETAATRSAVTNETGSYVLSNLPIGPYRLEASLPGFRTFAQTGIVLEVNASPETIWLARSVIGPEIQIDTHVDDALPNVVGDENQLRQVMMNLCLNARDAMSNGGTLTLATTAVRVDKAEAAESMNGRPGSFVCLTISDTGCGMTAEVQARLFEPFFTTKNSRSASGLGLATVYGLVKQHAG